jgi:metal-dependent amidase/aminoacylase/carboxypeptidase family protein
MEYLPGSVVIRGTPSEEPTVGSVGDTSAMAGAYDAVDACITFRPDHYTHIRSTDSPNEAIARAFRRNLETIGLELLDADVLDARSGTSRTVTDFGSIARRVPCLEAAISIAEPGVPLASATFAEAALSERAHGALLAAAKGLAMTTIDLLTDPSLLAETSAERGAGPGPVLGGGHPT